MKVYFFYSSVNEVIEYLPDSNPLGQHHITGYDPALLIVYTP